MKLHQTLSCCVLLCLAIGAHAQPVNDNCSSARVISLMAPTACPSNVPGVTAINDDNTGATPVSPYPSFLGCGQNGEANAVAAEVWYSFIAVADSTTITVDGLAQPVILFFEGEDCTSLKATDCASSTPGGGRVILGRNTEAGKRYFFALAGRDIDDQGAFTIRIESRRDCNPCRLQYSLTADPSPVNGTYQAGQTVTFCYSVENWDVSAIEWLHGVEVEFGAAWDTSTLMTQAPASCTNGNWEWYESWTSCTTGQSFGPGFAFDSNQGVGCGGTAFDGKPGNNWGDACQDVGGFPISFCWTITVDSCAALSGGADLDMTIRHWSDGQSGSWTQRGCNSGSVYRFLSKAICCNDQDPEAQPIATTCPEVKDGMAGIRGSDSLGVYRFTIFDSDGNEIGRTGVARGQVMWGDDEPGLSPGEYRVSALNMATGCERSATFVIGEGVSPVALVTPADPEACVGELFTLTASSNTPGNGIRYDWTGPGGPYSGENIAVAQEGTYILNLSVGECRAEPVAVTTRFSDLSVHIQVSDQALCRGNTATLTALANDTVSVSWVEVSTGAPAGLGSSIEIQPAVKTTYRVQATNDEGCVVEDETTILVSEPVDAGQSGDPARLCVGDAQVILLSDLIEGEDPGGTWALAPGTAPSGFQAAAGTFNTGGQPAGTYAFRYMLDAPPACPDGETEVRVILEPIPVADAGTDQLLTCEMDIVSLGGARSTTGEGISYRWTADNPSIFIDDPDRAMIDVSEPGNYTLVVRNDIGCSDTDEVVVSSDLSAPVFEYEVAEISCFQASDGVITVTEVSGGQAPYQFSVNGGPFSAQRQFSFLKAGTYFVMVRDGKGCTSAASILLEQPEELIVRISPSLATGNFIDEGDSILLTAAFTPNIVPEKISWTPDSLMVEGNPLSLSVTPSATTIYSVTVTDEKGCKGSDRLTIFVRKIRPVFFPNVFSPNGDGNNDIFFIQARADRVKLIRSFQIFNRWGTALGKWENFPPNDPAFGWDGTLQGQQVSSGVYVYLAEVEFNDGQTVIFQGDVALMR